MMVNSPRLVIALRMLVSFTVDGEPVPQSRPRFTKAGRTYTSKKCADYRKFVAACAKKAMFNKELFEKDVPIAAAIVFFRSKKTTAKADLDNLTKAILDACNQIVYYDDSQIVSMLCLKRQSDQPHVKVTFATADESFFQFRWNPSDVQTELIPS